MTKTSENKIIIFGRDAFEACAILLFGRSRRLGLSTVTSDGYAATAAALRYIPFAGKYTRLFLKAGISAVGNHKGLFYALSGETVGLTLSYFDSRLKNKNTIIDYYNRVLNTGKFEAYIKKDLSLKIFPLLEDLYLVRESGLLHNEILMVRSAMNEFVVEYAQNLHKVRYNIKWVNPVPGVFTLFIYYIWLAKELFRRGITFNRPRKKYKFSREAAMGFYGRTLRDDVLIDNELFGKGDMLMLEFDPRHEVRARAFEEAGRRGFDKVSLQSLRININSNIFRLLGFYLYLPVRSFFRLSAERQTGLFNIILSFHRTCLPLEILMNLYDIKCHVSTIDWGDVETTIVLNRYGARNIFINWGDMTPTRNHLYAFLAHNVYFVWGDIHYDSHPENRFIDKRVNVGCIFKEEYAKALRGKDDIAGDLLGAQSGKSKVAVFFDTSFSDHIHFTEQFFIDYISIIRDFCRTHGDVKVLLKPKTYEEYGQRLSPVNRGRYEKIWSELVRNGNFKFVDSLKWSIEEVLAVADVCVNMGMNSPAIVALICGKDALYFDNTGNSHHPFAKKYKDRIVFDDKELLFGQIDRILSGDFKCKDVVKDDEIRQFDAFADDRALDRIRSELCVLTESGRDG